MMKLYKQRTRMISNRGREMESFVKALKKILRFEIIKYSRISNDMSEGRGFLPILTFLIW